MGASVLDNYGVQVLTATSATTAIQIIHHFPLDLLIIDILIPLVSGISLIRAIRALQNTQLQLRQIPAIALSALNIEEQRIYALESGFQIYLTKPFALTLLLTEIVKLLPISGILLFLSNFRDD